MATSLRARLVLSTLITVLLISTLVGLVVIERLDFNQRTAALFDLKDDSRRTRELSLYVQYNAHDTNAYTLGHLEHRDEFAEHAAAFHVIADALQQRGVDGGLHGDAPTLLDSVFILRDAYDAASLALFDAADANRLNPSPANQAAEDAAWEQADQLGDQLDTASQELAAHLEEDITDELAALTTRNTQMLATVSVLGLAIATLTLFIQRSAAAALGRPLQQLLGAVQRFGSGELEARTGLRRQDEVGVLAGAFDALAERVGGQTNDLQAAYTASQAAQERAEAAHQALAAQLATIEEQRAVIREMSVPILPLSERSLVLPLIGALDTARLQLIQAHALEAIERSRARYLLLDVTGVVVIDTQVAHGLIQLVSAARLLGTEVVLVGVRPEVAQSIVGLGLQLDGITTRSTLQSGIAHALR